MAWCGNIGSSTLPIDLRDATAEGRVPPGDYVVLVGCGPAYSWAATVPGWTVTAS